MKRLKRLIYLKLARRLSKSTTGAPVPSIVSENTRLNGDILSDGIIHIDGQVEGDIACDELVIGVKGSVNGSIKANNLQLYGVLKGWLITCLWPNRQSSSAMRRTTPLPLSPVLILTDTASGRAALFPPRLENRI